jgi:HEAT repeat protein
VLEDGHPRLHAHAARALGQIGDPRALDALVAALRNTCYGARVAAIEALAQIGDRRALEPLTAALGDGDPCVRLAAAAALCRLNLAKTLP